MNSVTVSIVSINAKDVNIRCGKNIKSTPCTNYLNT